DIRCRIFGDTSGIHGPDVAFLARVYARKHAFAIADSLFQVALANQRRYVADTHYDTRMIFGWMSERYRIEGRREEATRFALLARSQPGG
ncbi:MAG TPA: hypothetical protein VH559_02085, partial [Gemmatimonadaceae bacterium]